MKKFTILMSLFCFTIMAGSAFAGSLTDKHTREENLATIHYSYEWLGVCATANLVKKSDTIIPLKTVELLYEISSYIDPYHLSNTDMEYEWALASLRNAGDMKLANGKNIANNFNSLGVAEQQKLKHSCNEMLRSATGLYEAAKSLRK